jgi:nucleotide-binding universal stress UspA family protein
VAIETHLVPGHVIDAVIGLVNLLNIDLLVVGFMGHSRLYGGSVKELSGAPPTAWSASPLAPY